MQSSTVSSQQNLKISADRDSVENKPALVYDKNRNLQALMSPKGPENTKKQEIKMKIMRFIPEIPRIYLYALYCLLLLCNFLIINDD